MRIDDWFGLIREIKLIKDFRVLSYCEIFAKSKKKKLSIFRRSLKVAILSTGQILDRLYLLIGSKKIPIELANAFNMSGQNTTDKPVRKAFTSFFVP